MAMATKKCRVCGKVYEACHTLRRVAGTFRWQDVACSPECGSIYLAKIEESRRIITDETKDVVDTVVISVTPESYEEYVDYVEDECEDEDLYDEDEFDDFFDDAEEDCE